MQLQPLTTTSTPPPSPPHHHPPPSTFSLYRKRTSERPKQRRARRWVTEPVRALPLPTSVIRQASPAPPSRPLGTRRGGRFEKLRDSKLRRSRDGRAAGRGWKREDARRGEVLLGLGCRRRAQQRSVGDVCGPTGGPGGGRHALALIGSPRLNVSAWSCFGGFKTLRQHRCEAPSQQLRRTLTPSEAAAPSSSSSSSTPSLHHSRIFHFPLQNPSFPAGSVGGGF